MRSLSRMCHSVSPSAPTVAAVAVTSSISASGPASPMMSMSHCKNWRYRPFCGRSARHTGASWMARNTVGSIGVVCRVEPGERDGEVEPQSEVDEVERARWRRGGLAASSPRRSTPKASFSLSPPRPACSRRAVFHDRGLDLVEAVRRGRCRGCTARAASRRGLLAGEEVAHAARGIDRCCHVSILASWEAATGSGSLRRSARGVLRCGDGAATRHAKTPRSPSLRRR